jgi:amidase
MAGEDPLDPPTTGSSAAAQRAPYEPYLKADALKGKRFGVPAFILAGDGIPFHGVPVSVPEAEADKLRAAANTPLRPETREMFMKAVAALRAAGAEIVIDAGILPASFAKTASRVATYAYAQDGTNRFLAAFGPAEYHSAAEYLNVVGTPLYPSSIGAEDSFRHLGDVRIDQRTLDTDPDAERMYHAPRRAMLSAYLEPLDRLKLDGYVYPAIQMPPPDETMPQDGRVSGGPHSATSWVNMIGVPAVVVPAGFYASGLPFGLEFSARPWTDGDLLGVAYAWEQATRLRKPPTLVERGLLAVTPARESRRQD